MPSNATETIDARILRLIGLEDVFDLDYDTYLTLLKEAMVKGRMPKTTIPNEEVELLTDEWKRVKNKKNKGRFKVKKKTIKATALKTGGIKTKIRGVPASKLLPAAQTQTGGGVGGFNLSESFAKIAEAVTSIVNILREKKKLSDKEAAFDKRAAEEEKRKSKISNLKKRFAKMAGAAQKVLKPVQSILDKIINYFMMIFLGRTLIKLLNWFTNPDNKGKIDSITRFLGDHWTKLLSLYLVFGTGLGRFIVGLSAKLVAGAIKLAAAAAKLAAAAALKKGVGGKFLGMRGGRWRKLSGLGRGWKGKALGIGITALGTGAATMGISKAIEGSGEEESTQGFSGGGGVKKGGGFGNIFGGLGKLFGGFGKSGGLKGAALGGLLLGPLGMLIGSIVGSKMDSDKPEGYVSGEKGVDKVPARLTEGEFVMSTGAVEKYGLDTLEGMNAAGGGTNKPKMMGSTTYAEGGGHIISKPRDMNDGHGKVKPLEDKKSKRKNLAIPTAPTAPTDQSTAQIESKSSKGIGGDIAQDLKTPVTLTSNGGGNFPLRSGKTYSWADIRPHHSNEGGIRSYAGKPVGHPKDYGIGVSPNYMPAGSATGPIPSPLAGKVLFADPPGMSGYGRTVLLETSKGLMQFSHLSAFGEGIKAGASVSAGQIIGAQGWTGSVSPSGPDGAHLHMNASKAGHEAFINYITMGKSITGSTSSIDRSLEDVDSATGFRGSPSSPTDQSTAQLQLSVATPSQPSQTSSKSQIPGAEHPGPKPVMPEITSDMRGSNARRMGREYRNELARWEKKKKRYDLVKDSVMAPKDGKMGWLNTKTKEWTPSDWTGADKERYKEKGGELTQLKPQGFMGLGDIFSGADKIDPPSTPFLSKNQSKPLAITPLPLELLSHDQDSLDQLYEDFLAKNNLPSSGPITSPAQPTTPSIPNPGGGADTGKLATMGIGDLVGGIL